MLVRASDGTVDTGFAPDFQFGGPSRFGGFVLRGDQLYLATGNALEGLDTQQRVGLVDPATGAVDADFRVPLRLVQNVDVRTLSSTDDGVFAGGDFTEVAFERMVAVYDLRTNRLLPRLGGDTEAPQLMAAGSTPTTATVRTGSIP